MSSRKKSALLGALLRGASPQHVHALVAIFLLVGSSSWLQGCKEPQHVGPCLSVEAVPPKLPAETSEPGAGRAPTMTSPKGDTQDIGEALRIGPCLKIAVDEPEDMGPDSGGDDGGTPADAAPPKLTPCLSIRMDEGANLDEIEPPGKQTHELRERTREEVLERLAGNLPQDVLARLRRELGENS